MPQIPAGSSYKLCFVNSRAEQKQIQAFETKGHPCTPGAQLPNLPTNVAFHQAAPILKGVPLEGSTASALIPLGTADQENYKEYYCSRQLLGGVCSSLETTTRAGIFVSRTAACSWHLFRNSRNRSVIQRDKLVTDQSQLAGGFGSKTTITQLQVGQNCDLRYILDAHVHFQGAHDLVADFSLSHSKASSPHIT